MSDPLVIALITTAVGVVLTAVLTPLGRRSVQLLLGGLSRVGCELSWKPTMGEGSVDSPGGVRFREHQLTVTLTNRRDVPVNVREMRVDFYKGGKPLDAQELKDGPPTVGPHDPIGERAGLLLAISPILPPLGLEVGL